MDKNKQTLGMDSENRYEFLAETTARMLNLCPPEFVPRGGQGGKLTLAKGLVFSYSVASCGDGRKTTQTFCENYESGLRAKQRSNSPGFFGFLPGETACDCAVFQPVASVAEFVVHQRRDEPICANFFRTSALPLQAGAGGGHAKVHSRRRQA